MLRTPEPEVIAELEKLGPDEVRCKLGRGEYGDIGSDLQLFVERWLTSEEARRKSASESRAEAREEAMLSTAREANSIALKARSDARRANIIATIAIILSTITAIIAASDKVILFLRWLGALKP